MHTLSGFFGTLKREWTKDQVSRHAAAIAYYAVFSVPSMLLLLIAIGGFFVGDVPIRREVGVAIDRYVGDAAGAVLQSAVIGLASPGRNVIMTIIGAVGLVLGGTAVLREMRTALDRILREPGETADGGWRHAVWHYMVGALLAFATALLLVGSMLTGAVLAGLREHASDLLPVGAGTIEWLNTLVSLGLLTLLLSLVYSFLTPKRYPVLPTVIGALSASVLLAVGKWLIGLYAQAAHIGAAYGVAASVLVLLLWLYFASLVVLLGAEIVDAAAKPTALPHKHTRKARPRNTPRRLRK